MRAYTRANADCRRSCLYFCRRLRPAHTRAYADCRRQSSNLLNFQGQRRPAQAFQPITKALQGHRGPTRRSDRDVCGRIPTHTLACLYFYPRRNLRYAVATHRQPQAWASAPAAGTYARMEYKPGFTALKGLIILKISSCLIMASIHQLNHRRHACIISRSLQSTNSMQNKSLLWSCRLSVISAYIYICTMTWGFCIMHRSFTAISCANI